MQHAKQLAMLTLVKYERETAEAAAKKKAPPDVGPSTHAPSIVTYF